MMRNIKTILIALTLVLSVPSVMTAQKVAHIDMQKLLEEMPEMKSAQAQLKKLEQTYTADIEASVRELQAKAQTYQNEAASLTEEQLRARESEFIKKSEEIQSMENNIRQAQQTASQELQKKQQELLEPILEKIKKAVDKVAKAQGFQYVFNASAGTNVIVAEGTDLYASVKKELGF